VFLVTDDHSRIILKEGSPAYINANLVEVCSGALNEKRFLPSITCSLQCSNFSKNDFTSWIFMCTQCSLVNYVENSMDELCISRFQE